MTLKQYIPSLEWLKSYDKEKLKGDLSAGLTVGVMLIPQGMAYSMLAGLPPIYGLYAATIPLIIYALLGTSRQLAVGPVAMVALLIASGVGNFAEPGSEQFITLAIVLALMVGLIQFGMGVFRLGFLVNFLSHPVISGFTSAAALIIGFSQLKHLLGMEIPRSHFIHEILYNALINAANIHWATLAIGLSAVAIIIFLKKKAKKIPGPLVVVILTIIAVYVLHLHDAGVKIVGDVPAGLPSFSIPSFSLENLNGLLPIALTISLIGFMESIAVAKAIQAKHKNYQVDSNQELIALGAANIFGAFFKSFPVTGGFSRTAVNDQAGAKTGMASMISAVLLILTLLFLTPLFYFLPKAVLASVIMVAVFGLVDYKEPIHLWKSDRRDFLMLIVTFVATLSLGVEMGIGVGVLLSLAMVIYRATYPHIAVLGKIEGTKIFRNIKRFENATQYDDILIIRFDAPMFFANTNYFRDKLALCENNKGSSIKLIIIMADAINDMDSTAVHAMMDLVDDYKLRNIDMYFSGVTGPVRDTMHKGGLVKHLGEDHFFLYVNDAVNFYNDLKVGGKLIEEHKYAIQTNVES
ncbi:MAG: solute carrier family 26 protein [Cyclobacteriaceae bacterium]|nr:solute carrier family 26 protein [Cyclobacteriaceae bacterium]